MNVRPKLLFVFAVANILLFLILFITVYRPLAAEFFHLRTLVKLQESRLAIKETQFMRYDKNSNEIYHEHTQRIIRYVRLIDVLSDISDAAKKQGLSEQGFFAAEPVIDQGIFHIQVTAEYMGLYKDICLYIHTLAAMPCFIDQLSITTEGTLWMRLSLYVIED